jgi:mono/diheme cytochrome c family protein
MVIQGVRRCSFAFITLAAVCLTLIAASARAQNPGGNPEAAKMKNPVAASPAAVTAGAASYRKYCAFCHGEAAKGDGKLAPKGTMPADLTDAKWDRGSTDGEIFAVIQNGAGPKFDMKGFKGRLPEQDTWNIIHYLRSLGPAAKR